MSTAPPYIFITILVVLGTVLGLFMPKIIDFFFKSKPLFEVKGLKIYGEEAIKEKIDYNELSVMIPLFISEFSMPTLLNGEKLKKHLTRIEVTLQEEGIDKKLRPDLNFKIINGITLSSRKVIVNVDESFQYNGKIRLRKTALLYELLNACLWALYGYEYAYCESFIDPENKENWRYIKDITDDKKIDDEDVIAYKAVRKRFNDKLKQVKLVLDHMLQER